MTEVFSRWYFGMRDNTPTRLPSHQSQVLACWGIEKKPWLSYHSNLGQPHFLVFSKKNPPGKSSKSRWNPEVFGHFRSSMHPKIAFPTAHVFLDRKRSNWQMRKARKGIGWWPIGKKLDRLRLENLSGSCTDGFMMFYQWKKGVCLKKEAWSHDYHQFFSCTQTEKTDFYIPSGSQTWYAGKCPRCFLDFSHSNLRLWRSEK